MTANILPLCLHCVHAVRTVCLCVLATPAAAREKARNCGPCRTPGSISTRTHLEFAVQKQWLLAHLRCQRTDAAQPQRSTPPAEHLVRGPESQAPFRHHTCRKARMPRCRTHISAGHRCRTVDACMDMVLDMLSSTGDCVHAAQAALGACLTNAGRLSCKALSCTPVTLQCIPCVLQCTRCVSAAARTVTASGWCLKC